MSDSRKFGIQSSKSSSDGRSSNVSGSTPPDIVSSPLNQRETEKLVAITKRENLVYKHTADTKQDVYFGKNMDGHDIADLSQTLNNDLNESYVQRAYRKEQLTDQTTHSLL